MDKIENKIENKIFKELKTEAELRKNFYNCLNTISESNLDKNFQSLGFALCHAKYEFAKLKENRNLKISKIE